MQLGCDAKIVCVDEAPCSIMDWLIIGVYVEELGKERSLVAGHSSVVSICFVRCSAPYMLFCLRACSE